MLFEDDTIVSPIDDAEPAIEGPVDADEPFNREDADIILRSSDNVDFRFYKFLLSLASPFFANLFTLPQPLARDMHDDLMKYGLPVIPVSEPSRVLEKVLKFCSPVYDTSVPTLADLDMVMAVLDAADKYDMKRVGSYVVRTIIEKPFLEKEPLRVFAIACRYRAAHETRIAARHLLHFAIWEHTNVSELDHISGADYFALVQYHAECGRAMTRLINLWSQYPLPQLDCNLCRKKGISRMGLKEYQDAVIDALRARPCVESLVTHEWVEMMLRRAGSCLACRDKAQRRLQEFARTFAEPVEEILSEIELKIDFSK